MTDNKSNIPPRADRVFFLHLRRVGNCNVIDTYTCPRTSAKGGRTVAYSYDDKGVTFAIAKVNPNDVYNKAIGRKVSSDRLAGENKGYWPGSVDQFRRAILFGLQVD